MEKVITRSKIKDLLKMQPGIEVTAKGWVRTKRGNKNVGFIALNDGSTINNIQVVCDMASFDDEKNHDRSMPLRDRRPCRVGRKRTGS